VFGVTLLLDIVAAAPSRSLDPADQANLEAVNAWIRSSASGFDGVIDLAALRRCLQRQCDSTSLFGPYNSGDNLHPSVAGRWRWPTPSPPRCSTSRRLPAAHDGHRHADARLRRCAGRRTRHAARPVAADGLDDHVDTDDLRAAHDAPGRLRPRRTSPWLPTVVIVAVVVAVAGTMGILLRRRSLRRRRQRRLLSPSADGRPAHQRRPVNR